MSISVDGEATPSIDFPFGFFCEGDIVPWGQPLVGNTAEDGGTYLTIKAPFARSIVVNISMAPFDIGNPQVNVVMR